jgi:hypothetical protein
MPPKEPETGGKATPTHEAYCLCATKLNVPEFGVLTALEPRVSWAPSWEENGQELCTLDAETTSGTALLPALTSPI